MEMYVGSRLVREAYFGQENLHAAVAALFSGGTKGGWWDPADTSTMFQDTAGTVPAALESPVALLKDKSGNGNHLVQATATARPTLSARYNLLTATEFAGGLADASHSSGNVSAVAFPGFAGGVAFTGNSVTSNAYQSPGVLRTGVGVVFSFYIIMDDGEAPVALQSTSSGDFTVIVESSIVGLSRSVVHIAGALYRVDVTKPSTTGGSPSVGVVKYTGQSSRTFRVTGYDLRYISGTTLPPYQRVTSSTDYDTAGFPYYLRFDGVDDTLRCPSFNLGSGLVQGSFGFGVSNPSGAPALVQLSDTFDTYSFRVTFNAAQARSILTGRDGGAYDSAKYSVSDTVAQVAALAVVQFASDVRGLRHSIIGASDISQSTTQAFGTYPLNVGGIPTAFVMGTFHGLILVGGDAAYGGAGSRYIKHVSRSA